MILIIKGRQRSYKTTLAVGWIVHLVRDMGYKLTDIVANCHLYKEDGTELQGYQYKTIRGIREYVREMVDKGIEKKIIFIDEIDRVFSHRFWQRVEQAEALTGLWQDEKLGVYVIGTAHVGKSIDIIIRDCMQLQMMPTYPDIKKDILHYALINILNRSVNANCIMHNLARTQKLFNTHEPIR